MKKISLSKLESFLKARCDDLRAAGLDATEYRDYIIAMIFLKRVNDLFVQRKEAYVRELKKRYPDLTDEELAEYGKTARSLGLSALVEAHDEREVERALRVENAVIGVNNRDLRDFTVDCRNSVRLRKLVPRDRIFVSESGIRTPEDIEVLRRSGTDAVLIGETLMRSPDKAAELRRLRGEEQTT